MFVGTLSSSILGTVVAQTIEKPIQILLAVAGPDYRLVWPLSFTRICAATWQLVGYIQARARWVVILHSGARVASGKLRNHSVVRSEQVCARRPGIATAAFFRIGNGRENAESLLKAPASNIVWIGPTICDLQVCKNAA